MVAIDGAWCNLDIAMNIQVAMLLMDIGMY